MNKHKKIHLSFLFASFLFTANAMASPTIDGVWKHASKPALIEFDMTAGIARVKQHLTHQGNAGLTIIKNITETKENHWYGEMFHGGQGKYVTVTIKLIGSSISIFDAKNKEVLKLIKE